MGTRILVTGAVLAAVLLVGLFVMARKSRDRPDLGLVDGSLRPCGSSGNCASATLDLSDEAGKRWEELKLAVREAGGEIIEEDPVYFRAEFKTPLFGFADDLEALLAGERIELRSSSRVGEYDFGVNQARIDRMRKHISN